MRNILLILLILPLSFALADFTPSHWQFSKDILLPQAVAPLTSLTAFQLDEEALTHSNANFSDLRVINEAGVETAFVLKRLEDVSDSKTISPRIFNLSSIPGKDTSFIVDIGDRKELLTHNSITLLFDADNKNFRRQVKIEGADSLDYPQWRVLNDRASIYDYSLEFHVRDTMITYPDSAYRYLRVTIIDVAQAPLKVVGAEAKKIFQKSAKTITYPSALSLRNEGQKTQVIADIAKQGLFTDTALLDIPDKNFERSVRIFSSNDKNRWEYRGADTIYQYDTPGFVGYKTTIRYSETNDRYLKFVIDNGDSPALLVKSISLQGIARLAAFLAEPKHSYSLYYGSALARAPQYDFASIYRYFESSTPILASLGRQKENSSFALPVSERSPWIFPTALAFIVITFGLLVFNLIWRTKAKEF